MLFGNFKASGFVEPVEKRYGRVLHEEENNDKKDKEKSLFERIEESVSKNVKY